MFEEMSLNFFGVSSPEMFADVEVIGLLNFL